MTSEVAIVYYHGDYYVKVVWDNNYNDAIDNGFIYDTKEEAENEANYLDNKKCTENGIIYYNIED